MTMTKMRSVLIALLILCCLFTCTGIAEEEQEASLVPAAEELIVPVGKSVLARYTLTPARLKKGGVTFESSDTSVATVGPKGYVRGRSEGKCTVTITSKKDRSVQAELAVWVVKPVKTVKASVPQKTLYTGERMQIDCSVSPADATIQGVTFTSRNKKVCIVNYEGMVTAVGTGTAEIVVRSADGAAQRELKFTVKQKPRSIRFKQEEYYVNAGKKIKFLATVLPKDASNKKLSWTSSDESVAKVDSTGRVTSRGVGDVTITATSVENPEVSASVLLHCVNPVKSVKFHQKVYDTGVGGVIDLDPIILPEDASHPRLSYEVVNRPVCTVDENGVVTTLRGGIATVIARTTDGSNRRAEVTIRSIVPVENVYFDQKSIRVEIGNHDFAYAKLKPLDATIKDMTWVSSDPSVATVSGEDTRVRITGHKWGRCTVTGTTEQGGYSASIAVSVGALRDVLTLENVSSEEGKVYAVIRNNSDMHITSATLVCADSSGEQEEVSLALDLPAGAATNAMEIGSSAKIRRAALKAWETDTGYENDAGALRYAYRISPGLQEWKSVK